MAKQNHHELEDIILNKNNLINQESNLQINQ